MLNYQLCNAIMLNYKSYNALMSNSQLCVVVIID